MQIKLEPTSRGFTLMIDGEIWKSDPCEMQFPKEVWETFPAKAAFVNELAYILTIAPPLILKHPTVWYPTPEPIFFDFYNRCFESAIPNMVDLISSENSEEILERFRSTGRHFSGSPRFLSFPELNAWEPRRVVLPLSFGKDSLTSLATLNRMGYEVIAVQVDDRVLPRVMSIRNDLAKEMTANLGYTCRSVRNEAQLLSDYQVLKQPETRLHQVHIYFVYLFAMIPFCTYYRAPTIILSNEYCNSLNRLHREGYLIAHMVMQNRIATAGMARLLQRFSGGQITAVNLIGGLGNFALYRILHEEFPSFGKYQVSCHLEVSKYARWCHKCYRCSQAFVYFLASGLDPFDFGFEASMLEEEKKSHYSLFRESIHRKDVYHRFVRQEEELAFLMAHRRGVEGPLMERFRGEFLPETEEKEAKLMKRVLRVQRKPGKSRIEKEADSLYRELLSMKNLKKNLTSASRRS
jgi:hypothetical protein